MKQNIAQLKDRILELETQATKQTSVITDMPRGGSGESDKMADTVAKMVDLMKMLNNKIYEALEREIEIEKAIEKLSEREQHLIRARYINGISWERIAVLMNYSWKQTHRIHSDALKNMTHNDTQKTDIV